MHANEVVSTDRLIHGLWGERPPKSAAKLLQGYVSHLRRGLADAPGDEDHAGEGGLLTRPPGYVLRLEPGQLDAERFLALLKKARAALEQGAAHDASLILREALGLWRGPPLADFAYEPFAQEEIGRLEELRLTALEERIEADLALGRQAELVGELEALITRHPLRERVRAQLMLALYRCDRQSEALQAYQEARRLLVAELGLEPGRSLRELEQAILRQDPSLDLASPAARKLGGERRSADALAAVERAPPVPPRRRPESVFVGREPELAELRAALEEAFAGRGHLFLICGEPGIGKSRLAEELASEAKARGAQVLWGRCWEAGGAPAYWPWVQAIRSHIRDCEPEQLRADLGSAAPAIAEIVSEVRERLPDLGAPAAPPDPQQARFRLFDSLTAFVKRASDRRPLVLVLDDLHWADAGSLLLLEFVTRELADAHVFLIATYRDVEVSRRHPLSQTLAELARERLYQRILLGGLSEREVGRFLAVGSDPSPPVGLVRALHAQTEGNPLFLTEVVRLLLQEGELTAERMGSHERWSVRIPEGIREVIGRRLERLSEPCSEVLTIASVIGREFGLDQLRRLIEDVSEERLLELLEEALAAHVIEELPRALDRYQFTHTLIQETLADELSRARRARLHARIAPALEELYGADTEAHAAELAHHFTEAESLLGPEKHIHYSLLAGEAALAAHAHEQALEHFERARTAKEGQPMDAETAAILFGLGRAQLATFEGHELEQALATLDRAFDYYAESGDVARAVTVATHPPPSFLDVQAKSQMPGRALGLVPPDSHEAGQLLAAYGWFAGVGEADYETAQGAFERALALAQRYGDLSLETRTLARAAYVDSFHTRWHDCREKALRAIELAARSDDLQSEVIARTTAARAFTVTAEPEQASLQAAASLALAEKLRDGWWLSTARFNAELLSAFQGDWQATRELLGPALEARPRDPRHLGLQALLAYQLGNFKEGVAHSERLLEAMRSVRPPGPTAEHPVAAAYLALVGRIAGRDDYLAPAKEAAEAVLSLPGVVPSLTTLARAGAALVAVQSEDHAAAEALYAALAAQRGVAIPVAPLAADRVLALLSVTLGQLEAALAHFEDALALCERGGYRPEYAWTAHEYAAALRNRGDRGDERKAASLDDRALVIAREFGLLPLIQALSNGEQAEGLEAGR